MEVARFWRRKYGNHVFDEVERGWEDGPDGDVVHGVPGRVRDGSQRPDRPIQVPETWRAGHADGGGVRRWRAAGAGKSRWAVWPGETRGNETCTRRAYCSLEQLQSYRKLGKNPQRLKPGNLLQRNRRHECLLHPVMAHIHAENALAMAARS